LKIDNKFFFILGTTRTLSMIALPALVGKDVEPTCVMGRHDPSPMTIESCPT
jgi:hypothetical protein